MTDYDKTSKRYRLNDFEARMIEQALQDWQHKFEKQNQKTLAVKFYALRLRINAIRNRKSEAAA